MSDVGPPATKRLRLRRPSQPTITPLNRYMLRSRARRENVVVETIPLQDEPRRKRPKRCEKLMDLNHDCLLRIFQHTDVSALCHVAETCDRLHELTRYAFRLKHSRFVFSSLLTNGFIRHSTAKKCLRNFGDLMVSMNLSMTLFEGQDKTHKYLLRWVQRYCTNLKDLKLEDFKINPGYGAFNTVVNLELDNCEMRGSDLILPNAKMVKFVGSESEVPLYDRYPQLEDIQVISCNAAYTLQFEDLFTLNPTIKRLSIIKCYNVSSEVMGSLARLQHLEEFSFQLNRPRIGDSFQNDLAHLTSLNNLKVLALNCQRLSVARLVEGFAKKGIAIESLELANGPMNDATFENIIKLKSIKVLKLNEMTELSEVQVMLFGKRLPALEQLHIKSDANISRTCVKALVQVAGRLSCLKMDAPSFNMNFNMYTEMLDIVKKRDPFIKLTLSIFVHGNGQQFAFLDERNAKWLEVKEFNHNQKLFPYPAKDDDFDADFFDFDDDDDFDDERSFLDISGSDIDSDMEEDEFSDPEQ